MSDPWWTFTLLQFLFLHSHLSSSSLTYPSTLSVFILTIFLFKFIPFCLIIWPHIHLFVFFFLILSLFHPCIWFISLNVWLSFPLSPSLPSFTSSCVLLQVICTIPIVPFSFSCKYVCLRASVFDARRHKHVHAHAWMHTLGIRKLVLIKSNISHLSAQLLSVHLCPSVSLPCLSSSSLQHTHMHTLSKRSSSTLSAYPSSLVELLNKSTAGEKTRWRQGDKALENAERGMMGYDMTNIRAAYFISSCRGRKQAAEQRKEGGNLKKMCFCIN